MPRKAYTDFCPYSGDQRTITIDSMDFPFAADPSAKIIKCGFECDKYLYGYCPNAKACALFEKS